MEAAITHAWIIFKWILPAAIGSGLAVFIDTTESSYKKKFGMFVFGALVSIFAGGAIIGYYNITDNAIQGFIYWAVGVWGMGIVIQITKQIPLAITGLREKYIKK